MNKFIIALLLSVAVVSVQSAQSSCNALAIQGGADQGAYLAGGIIGLIQNAPNGQAQWDVITAVGIGAINLGILSQYPLGQEAAAAAELQNTWSGFKASTWYKNWLAGPVQGLLIEPGLYTTKNAQKWLSQTIKNDPQRYVQVGSCDANQAEYIPFNNFDGSLDAATLQTGILASYATAGIFPYVNYNGNTLIDGSSLKSLDIAGAIEQCRRLTNGVMDDVYLDIVMFSSKQWSEINVTDYTALKMLLVTLSLTTYRSTMYDIQKAQWDYPDVNFRYLVAPGTSLPTSTVPLGYSKAENEAMINQGIADAKSAIALGAGAKWNEYVEFTTEYLTSTFGAGATLDKTPEHAEMVEMLRQAFAEEAKNAVYAEEEEM